MYSIDHAAYSYQKQQNKQNLCDRNVSVKHLDTLNMNVANVHLYLNNRDQLSVCSYWERSV